MSLKSVPTTRHNGQVDLRYCQVLITFFNFFLLMHYTLQLGKRSPERPNTLPVAMKLVRA